MCQLETLGASWRFRVSLEGFSTGERSLSLEQDAWYYRAHLAAIHISELGPVHRTGINIDRVPDIIIPILNRNGLQTKEN